MSGFNRAWHRNASEVRMKVTRFATHPAAAVGACLAIAVVADPASAQTFVGATPTECSTMVSPTEPHPTKKTGYIDDIQNIARAGDDYRRVLYTGANLQLVIMALATGDNIGPETRMDHDLFLRIEAGQGQVNIDGMTVDINENSGIIIPAGTLYSLTNTGPAPLKLYIAYGAPEFASNSVRATRSEAEASPDAFDGCTTE
jgi:mannose-6-phosphate isomerase-like protein (cupin superfamily)